MESAEKGEEDRRSRHLCRASPPVIAAEPSLKTEPRRERAVQPPRQCRHFCAVTVEGGSRLCLSQSHGVCTAIASDRGRLCCLCRRLAFITAGVSLPLPLVHCGGEWI
ncbi:uncharacterized protein DS421_16g550080 [Arachis hypogaea]|nr:uncharacterized protein DS421_16g550080 [Arachis hypogaea]